MKMGNGKHQLLGEDHSSLQFFLGALILFTETTGEFDNETATR